MLPSSFQGFPRQTLWLPGESEVIAAAEVNSLVQAGSLSPPIANLTGQKIAGKCMLQAVSHFHFLHILLAWLCPDSVPSWPGA